MKQSGGPLQDDNAESKAYKPRGPATSCQAGWAELAKSGNAIADEVNLDFRTYELPKTRRGIGAPITTA